MIKKPALVSISFKNSRFCLDIENKMHLTTCLVSEEFSPKNDLCIIIMCHSNSLKQPAHLDFSEGLPSMFIIATSN